MPDFEIEDHFSVFLVRPLSDEAREYVQEYVYVEGWQWENDSFACDRRVLDDLLDGIEGYGFEVKR